MDLGLLPYQAIGEIAMLACNWAGPLHKEKGPNAARFSEQQWHGSFILFSLHVFISIWNFSWSPPPTFSHSSINQTPRSKTESAGDGLIKDVGSWYSFLSLTNSRFGSHKVVLLTWTGNWGSKDIIGMLWWSVSESHQGLSQSTC